MATRNASIYGLAALPLPRRWQWMVAVWAVLVGGACQAGETQQVGCRDFSGQYVTRSDDGGMEYHMRQEACSSIMIVTTAYAAGYAPGGDTLVAPLDGKPHRGPPNGQLVVASIVADTLQMTFLGVRNGDTILGARHRWRRLANGDLCGLFTYPSGDRSMPPRVDFLAGRYEGSDDQAAGNRSESPKVCAAIR